MTSDESHLEMTSRIPAVTSENANIVTATVVIQGCRYKQRQLGPAPFASFEDLSDELDSPPETARVPLPGIKEDPSSQVQSPNTSLPQMTDISLTEKEEQCLKDSLVSSLDTPAPPRIDISRASSSSQHEDSITSSPERENGTHNLGYREDGTAELRSSTEELDYIQEPGTVQESEEKRKREKMMKRQQQVRDFGDTQSQHEFIERKDSSCSVMSEIVFLSISGRTSRISSIGSAASGGSAASAASHLSAGSNLSGRSTRSPSPHKMLLETSFCGSKPMHSQNQETEASPSLVAVTEKSASRPPSRLRSRSPSPHKMLLETSFCGTKQIIPPEMDMNKKPSKEHKKDESKVKGTTVVEAEVEQKKISQQEVLPKQQPLKMDKNKQVEKKVEKLKATKSDQIKKVENTLASGKAKPMPAKSVSKPKKIISLRDIPVDEIYIPLKGPELDFEEIMRNASPNLRKKEEKPESEVEIFIPLHSPPKTSADIGKKQARSKQDTASCDLLKSSKTKASNKLSSQVPEQDVKSALGEKQQRGKQERKKREYEVCEDGSIFIPLHSPDEDGSSNNFEEKIKQVDQELQKAREAAEKRLRSEEEEKQIKPATLDLSDSGSHQSRLFQSSAAGKTELLSGGSRTPSPGSTLSRKSSFASLFKKSDIFSSPDSQSSATLRKKSGTFSNILKETSDGLRERSRSRSKSKERQTQSSTSARSPSGKKNVFTNLFAKKKADGKVGSGKENEQLPPRLDLQFTFSAGNESHKTCDEGDYIIIPLRDPSDPPDSLDIDSQLELSASCERENQSEKPSSPLIVLEKLDSVKTIEKARGVTELGVEEKVFSNDSKSLDKKSDSETLSRRSSSESKTAKNLSKKSLELEDKVEEKSSVQYSECGVKAISKNTQETFTSKSSTNETEGFDFEEKHPKKNENHEEDNKLKGALLQHDSSVEIEEKSPKEETDKDVGKLKLPSKPSDLEEDHERKGLVYQESFEDELPYVPTTLPLERPVGVRIVPVKHRVNEIKTCSIERPRSTTPINPTTLEDFVSVKETMSVSSEEKMKISLPRDNSITSKSKSPTRYSGKGKTWFEFAEAVLQSPRDNRKSSLRTTPSPPPLPPRSSPLSVLSSSAPPTTTSWINFEELPEKRKLPKRITTVPTLRSSADGNDKSGTSVGGGVVYSYVSPEDCQCECHDHNASHSKESEHERGQKNDLMMELKPNSELNKKGFASKSKISKSQKGNGKSECKDCESGIHALEERDIEETPLLDVDSDEEDDYFLGKGSSLTKPATDLEADKARQLSESSGECPTQEDISEPECNHQINNAKPFEMDLEVDSNRSSLLSEDAWSSPDDPQQ